jgi:hypothetical protein
MGHNILVANRKPTNPHREQRDSCVVVRKDVWVAVLANVVALCCGDGRVRAHATANVLKLLDNGGSLAAELEPLELRLCARGLVFFYDDEAKSGHLQAC